MFNSVTLLAPRVGARKPAESLRRENGGDSLLGFPPRGVRSSPALARPRPGFFLPRSAQRLLFSLCAACVALLTFVAAPAIAQPFAYVPNEGSGTISVIDTATDTVTGEIRTGGKPRGIALNPKTQMLYVSDSPSSTLKVIDVRTRETINQVSLG